MVFLGDNDEIPEGFYIGNCKTTGPRKDLKVFYENPETGFSKRFASDVDAPDGWIKGRGNFNNVGSKGMNLYTDFKKTFMYKPEDKPNNCFLGKKGEKVFVVMNIKDDEIIGFFTKAELVRKFPISLLKTSKEKFIGHNKKYISRLSKEVKEILCYFIEEVTIDKFLEHRKIK